MKYKVGTIIECKMDDMDFIGIITEVTSAHKPRSARYVYKILKGKDGKSGKGDFSFFHNGSPQDKETTIINSKAAKVLYE